MKDLKIYYTLNASPEDVYNALVNQVMVEIWTGESAVMSEEPGSEFSLWDGSITGKNLEFEKNRMIRQEWYFEGEPEASLVTILLHTNGNVTQLEVRQTNIPDEAFSNISDGWKEDYLGGLSQLFED